MSTKKSTTVATPTIEVRETTTGGWSPIKYMWLNLVYLLSASARGFESMDDWAKVAQTHSKAASTTAIAEANQKLTTALSDLPKPE